MSDSDADEPYVHVYTRCMLVCSLYVSDVYEGKDLDTYDSSFIDDEAVEQSDASREDKSDGGATALSDADEVQDHV